MSRRWSAPTLKETAASILRIKKPPTPTTLPTSANNWQTKAETAAAIRTETGADVTTVAADVTTPEGQAALLAACPEPDILVNNAGGPPPGDFRDWSREDWIAGITANMLTPIELMKATVDGMIGRGFGRIRSGGRRTGPGAPL